MSLGEKGNIGGDDLSRPRDDEASHGSETRQHGPDGNAAAWLDRVDSEIERLRARLNEAHAELASCEARNRELEKANARLRSEVNDLQAYIDERKAQWAEMQKCIEQLDDALVETERVVPDASRKDGDNEFLSRRIVELERRCSELAGRLRETERTHRDRVAKLEERIFAQRAELAELKGVRERLDEKVEELERVASERASLEARLREAHEKLAALDQRHGGTAGELRALRQELVAQQHLIDKLETELESKQRKIETLQKQVGASAHHADVGAGEAADDHDDTSDDVRIVRIGELFRRDPQTTRRPIAVLEALDGTKYPVTKPSVTIGRASTNDICIRREFVSRMHARLTVQGIGAIIEDVGSKNGILVNSEPTKRRLLIDGDIISLGGKLDLKYVELDGPSRVGAPGARTEAQADP